MLDLDPGPPAGLLAACRVALLLRDELDARGLAWYPKTSGGKGLHVYVPVHGATYEGTKGLARRLAQDLAAAHPDLVADRVTKALRTKDGRGLTFSLADVRRRMTDHGDLFDPVLSSPQGL